MKKAFTLVEILIVVAILGLIAAIGIPSFLGSRNGAEDNIEQINRSSVDAAKEQWAIINNKATGSACTWDDIKDYIGGSITSTNDFQISDKYYRLNINPIGTPSSYSSK